MFILVDVLEIGESRSDGFSFFTENSDGFSLKIEFSLKDGVAGRNLDIILINSLEFDICEVGLMDFSRFQNLDIVGVSLFRSYLGLQLFAQDFLGDMSS